MTNRGKKATNAEIAERLKIMYELLVRGNSRTEIIEYFAKKFNVSSNQVDKYINQTYSVIARNNSAQLEEMRALATTRYQRWMRKAEADGNIPLASQMQARIDKINALEVIVKKIEKVNYDDDKNLLKGLLTNEDC